MIQQAIASFYENVETPDPKRSLPETRPWPKIPHLLLSLTLDVLRGEVKGILEGKLDKELGFRKDEEPVGKYLRYFEQEIHAVSIHERSTAAFAKRQKYKKTCKWEGCGKYAWSGSGSDGHCYGHTDPSKKLCKECKHKTRQKAGGLCVSCDQRSGPRNREPIICSCGLRWPVRHGSRCSICIGSDQKKARQNRAGNCSNK